MVLNPPRHMTTLQATKPADATTRLRIALRGAVQGVGFRPFVHRLAGQLGLAGWVNNSPEGVWIEAEGPHPALEAFLLRLDTEKPSRSFIQSLESSWLDPVGYSGFEIRATEANGRKIALVLPDIATCPDCLREVFDPTNRRHRYPFTNCTHCGPRFSIIEAVPYDRVRTSMRRFRMCPACEAEYEDPGNRRFHAQPNACPVCGPRLEFCRGGSRACAAGDAALLASAREIRQGRIVAVKGIGGFHLMVDARNQAAVRRLRERKHREEKPFALMFPSLAAVQTVCELSAPEARLLCSPEAPIVLLRRIRNRQSAIVNEVAPGNPYLGVMLPSNPLQHLLMLELGFPVVATSGNLSDEPICIDEHEAFERLSGIADAFLVHNRPIVRHVDDSIVHVMLDREMVLRRARGYAPLPVELQSAIRDPETAITLAVGAHLKSSVALAIGTQVFISQHIGDLETEQASNAFHRVIADFKRLYEVAPEVVVADLHPDYLSTKFAGEMCRTETADHDRQDSLTNADSPGSSGKALLLQRRRDRLRCPRCVAVQHHIAHVLSCVAENGLEPPVLGVAWDGTGYGTDGTIWGGEFFLVTQDNAERIAHWRPFRLPGGEAAVQEPRRSALGLLYALREGDLDGLQHLPAVRAFQSAELRALIRMLGQGLHAPLTSSTGRLFDAVAALIGLRQLARHEGQAAMELEFAADDRETDETYEVSIANPQPPMETNSRSFGNAILAGSRNTRHAARLIDWTPMIEAILDDVRAGLPVGLIAARFHNSLAATIVDVAQLTGVPRVALSGGCFQNRRLTECTVTRLREAGFQPYWHQRVPPNDGGIALGQILGRLRAKHLSPATEHPLP